MHKLVPWSLASFVLLPSIAHAQLMQPDGTSIPTDEGLTELFAREADPIDAYSDGSPTPEVFAPSCRIEFEFVEDLAAFQNDFGWYNASGARPPQSELYTLLPHDSEIGTRFTLDIRNDSRYRGGNIGFWLHTSQDCAGDITPDCGRWYFSERRLNDDGSGGVDNYIHLIVYDSRAHESSFYFAWEDLFRGGDNDFTDVVTRVDNIVCLGGGQLCETEGVGVCRTGRTLCRAGALVCESIRSPGTETCNGLDDDCDGQTDDGDDLCARYERCHLGQCVPYCTEFDCPFGSSCQEGLCVETACTDVRCEAGQICRGGTCHSPCDGVVCPHGQQCIAGRCQDACQGVECEGDQVCVDGACVAKCQCLPCRDAGMMCSETGRCEATACAGVDCAAGTHCDLGACVDDCAGVVCPTGETCSAGRCSDGEVTIQLPSMNGDAGPDGGPDGGAHQSSSGDDDDDDDDEGSGGCDCGVARGESSLAWWILGLLALVVRATLRRRGSAPARSQISHAAALVRSRADPCRRSDV